MNLPQEKLSSSITFVEERNVFVKPDEQNRACSSYAMARKGARSERIFDDMNNGFGWNRLPKSFIAEHSIPSSYSTYP